MKFHLFYRTPPTFVFIRKNKNKLDSIQGCKKLYYGGGGGGGGGWGGGGGGGGGGEVQ